MKSQFLKKIIFSLLAIFCLSYTIFSYSALLKQSNASKLNLPKPSMLLKPAQDYSLPKLRGLRLDPQNPLNLEFLFESSNTKNIDDKHIKKCIEYFLTSLSVEDSNLWVNLAPF